MLRLQRSETELNSLPKRNRTVRKRKVIVILEPCKPNILRSTPLQYFNQLRQFFVVLPCCRTEKVRIQKCAYQKKKDATFSYDGCILAKRNIDVTMLTFANIFPY